MSDLKQSSQNGTLSFPLHLTHKTANDFPFYSQQLRSQRYQNVLRQVNRGPPLSFSSSGHQTCVVCVM